MSFYMIPVKFYSLLLLVVITSLVTSCSSEENNPDQPAAADDDSLTGTWLELTQLTYFDLSDIKTSASTLYSSVYISENTSVISFNTCTLHYDPSSLPIQQTRKGSQLQDIGNFYTPFTIINNRTLTRTTQQLLSDSRLVSVSTYNKIDTALISTGAHLSINGPITASSTTKTCLFQIVSENKDSYTYDLSIPLADESMILQFSLTQPLATGRYVYDINERGNAPVLYNFYITSFDTSFINAAGSNSLSPDVATINITSSGKNLIQGSYSFTSQTGDDYSGEFSFAPYSIN